MSGSRLIDFKPSPKYGTWTSVNARGLQKTSAGAGLTTGYSLNYYPWGPSVVKATVSATSTVSRAVLTSHEKRWRRFCDPPDDERRSCNPQQWLCCPVVRRRQDDRANLPLLWLRRLRLLYDRQPHEQALLEH